MLSLSSSHPKALPVSRLTPCEVSWLWPGWLPVGKLAILDGDPGLGKSLLALDLCARLTTGRPFPGCTTAMEPANALILNGEDGEEDTIRPRLQAVGADLDRVFVVERDHTAGLLSFPEQTAALDALIAEARARLVVLDPVMAFLDRSVLSGHDASVRRALFPLAQLAARHRCALLLIRHLNKSGGGRAMYRGGGSIAFVGACRSAWLVAPEPKQPGRRVLAQVKNNLAPPQPSLAYELLTQPSGPPQLSWLGDCVWSADQLLTALAQDAPLPTERERARDFLTAFLEDGPRTTKQIWAAAQDQRLGKRTLQRARRDLKIRTASVQSGDRRENYWLLDGQRLPVGVEEEGADLREYLRQLEERWGKTPLDEG